MVVIANFMKVVRDCRRPFWDKKGREIRPGDLLKTFHFSDSRGRKHWLYHTVVAKEFHGKLYFTMVPTCHLEPTKAADGGDCRLTKDLAEAAEIIFGLETLGKDRLLVDFTDRRKHTLVEEGLKL